MWNDDERNTTAMRSPFESCAKGHTSYEGKENEVPDLLAICKEILRQSNDPWKFMFDTSKQANQSSDDDVFLCADYCAKSLSIDKASDSASLVADDADSSNEDDTVEADDTMNGEINVTRNPFMYS